MKIRQIPVIAVTIITAAVLSACGGGGGGDNTGANNPPIGTNPDPSTVPAGSTLTTPNYAADSAKATMFGLMNQYRSKCGFPAYQQNTVLDASAQAHADYQIGTGVVSDTETAGTAGFTGVTAQDRAVAKGWPKSIGVGTVSGGVWMNSTQTQATYGKSLVDAWSVGVYHQVIIAANTTLAGFGVGQHDLQGFPEVIGTVVHAYGAATPANIVTSGNVLTFPCDGVSGIPAKGTGESPTPPSTSGPWGTPITVVGNPSDTVVLTAGSITAVNAGTTSTVKLLNADSDPNKLVQKSQAVAYPLAPLAANTAYAVTLTGTVNGTAFSRSFTFTTAP